MHCVKNKWSFFFQFLHGKFYLFLFIYLFINPHQYNATTKTVKKRVKQLCGMPLTCSQNITRHIHYKIYNIKILDPDAVEHHNVHHFMSQRSKQNSNCIKHIEHTASFRLQRRTHDGCSMRPIYSQGSFTPDAATRRIATHSV